MFPHLARLFVCIVLVAGARVLWAEKLSWHGATADASGSANGFGSEGAIDGDRFSPEGRHAWKGLTNRSSWIWQVHFEQPRKIGAILQIVGDHPFVLRNAPHDYVWQSSDNGKKWRDVAAVTGEQRAFRIHRLARTTSVSYLRMRINSAHGSGPTLREVEFFSEANDTIPFPEWIVAVNTTDKRDLPGEGKQFIPLAQSCAGTNKLEAQHIWVGAFDERFIDTEPRPLCAFLSGNFKDWCEISRQPWRGTQNILGGKRIPIWASCGGAQGLAILAETGVDRPWDCPHCRDPLAPKTPIYTHIGHTGIRPCGDYSACIFERGPHQLKQIGRDPVFRGLPEQFAVMESHCGQIEWPPKGWELIATAGPGTKTKSQCLRVKDQCIYAAQFHIEMDGTPESSRQIMSNFLGLAREWHKAASSHWPGGKLFK